MMGNRCKISWLNHHPLLYGKQFFGQIGRSDWLIFGRDFTVRTITVEMVRLYFFLFAPGKFKE